MRGISFFTMLFILFGLSIGSAQKDAQKITVTGTVTDAKGQPVKKVQIYVDSVKVREKTNKKGEYKIKIDEESKLVSFYSPSHGIVDKEYTGQEELDLSFPEKGTQIITSIEDLKALGYKEPYRPVRGTGEINFEDDPAVSGYSSIFQLIAVRFAGVAVNGETISIRGSATQSMADNVSKEPLYIVDGSTVSSIASIAPNRVKSIKILKSSESGKYGMRGANGVVIITLKKGI